MVCHIAHDLLVPMTLDKCAVAYHGDIELSLFTWNAVFEPAHDMLVPMTLVRRVVTCHSDIELILSRGILPLSQHMICWYQ